MADVEGRIQLSAAGGDATAGAVDRVSGAVNRMTASHKKMGEGLAGDLGARNVRLLSHEFASLAGATGPAGMGVANVIHAVIEGMGPIAIVTGLVVAAVAVWADYKKEQEEVAKKVKASFEAHSALLAKIDDVSLKGVRLTGVMRDYADAVKNMARVEREQYIVSLVRERKETLENAKALEQAIMGTIKQKVQMALSLTTLESSRVANKKEAEVLRARAYQLKATIGILETYGSTFNEVMAKQERSTAAVTKAQEALYDSSIKVFALDPGNRVMADRLRIEEDRIRTLQDLKEAGLDEATAVMMANQMAAQKTREAWFSQMSAVQGLLEGGFKDAFQALGKGSAGAAEAFKKFRDSVIGYIQDMIAKQLAFNVIAAVGGGGGTPGTSGGGGFLSFLGRAAGAIMGASTGGAAGLVMPAVASVVAQHGAVIPGPTGAPVRVSGIMHGGERVVSNNGRGAPVGGGEGGGGVHLHAGALTPDTIRLFIRSIQRAQGSRGERRFK